MQAFLVLHYLDIYLNQLAMGSESASQEKEKQGLFARGWLRIKAFLKNIKTEVFEFVSKVKKLGQDDPRRVVHSLKVGFALTLVSLFYYCQPLYNSFGVSAMWAVMTVVVVFEFSVGKFCDLLILAQNQTKLRNIDINKWF